MLWLGLHLPMLPLEVFSAARAKRVDQAGTASAPEVPGAPEVVVEQGRIMLRNAAAAAAGIAVGSTLATAHSIVPGLVHYRRDPEREHHRLKLLAETLYGFSARVSLAPPAGLALEIGGSLKLFGDALTLVRRIEALGRDMGHQLRARQARTPLAALVLARADTSSLDEVALSEAAVEPERLSAERIERCANMGVHTVGQLLALPRRGLARRFGPDLVDYLQRLTGDQPDPRPCIQPAERFRTTLHLLEPLGSKEALAFPMQRLLGDLQQWLVARQLAAEQLRWHFTGSGSGGSLCMPVRFARAQQNREAFLDITRLQLAQAELPDEVISLALEANRVVPWTADHASLFRHLPEMARHLPMADGTQGSTELSQLVDQLRARLGRGACYSLEVRDQHTPEHAWSPAPPRGASPSRADPPTEGRPRPLTRPLWLFDPPRPIDPEQLTLLRGPERIHAGWWLSTGEVYRNAIQEPIRDAIRDYYVARHRHGAQCWVFVDSEKQWFLQGYFS